MDDLAKDTIGNCRLCGSSTADLGIIVRSRKFEKCSFCGSIQAQPSSLITMNEEKARYDTHNNEGAKYEAYLNSILDEWWRFSPHNGCHLDYGCGPNPLLSTQVRKRGLNSDHYDPIYYPENLRDGHYDLITMIESSEHFNKPKEEFLQAKKLLKKGGSIIVVTNMYEDQDPEKWWYMRDITHSFFYSHKGAEIVRDIFEKTNIHIDSKGFAIYG
jgi:hypothetical protein